MSPRAACHASGQGFANNDVADPKWSTHGHSEDPASHLISYTPHIFNNFLQISSSNHELVCILSRPTALGNIVPAILLINIQFEEKNVGDLEATRAPQSATMVVDFPR